MRAPGGMPTDNTADVPLRIALGRFLASNIHIILIAMFVGYFVYQKVLNAYHTRPVKRSAATMETMQEKMAAARRRQQEAVVKAQLEQRQKEERSPNDAGVVAAADPLLNNTEGRGPSAARATSTSGRTAVVGNSASGSAAIARSDFDEGERAKAKATAAVSQKDQSAKPPANRLAASSSDDDEDPRGPRKRLPKLSGGDRAAWEANNKSAGGGEHKNYFKRDCGPKGG